MAELKIGTCSWKYDSWRGLVYTHDPEINYLREYSKIYDYVEIDQWFWSLRGINNINLPQQSSMKNYKESVPPDFKFAVKIPNSITLTHFYKTEQDEPLIPNQHFLSLEIMNEFIALIKPLHKNLGPLMFQFEYLNKEKMKSQFEFQGLFREFAGKLPEGFLFSIETRNPNYLTDTYFQFLRDNKLGHVFLQGYYMPPIYDIYAKFKDYIKNYAVIRLHGADRKGIEQRTGGEWNRIVEPKDEELKKIIAMILELLDRKVDVYLNVNNHYEGSAPLTILRIKEYMANK
jgi:uncharacterized protein YecE (DUF72 family)